LLTYFRSSAWAATIHSERDFPDNNQNQEGGNRRECPQGSCYNPGDTDKHQLEENKQDAGRDCWPETYRKTGPAIWIALSHEKGYGDELTSGQVEQILDTCAGDTEKIQ
jgi:hypothetical protein